MSSLYFTVYSENALVVTYKATWCHTPEDHNKQVKRPFNIIY
jgi:hypothetical protein